MWTKVLKGANVSTGCSMLSLDAKNPKTLYAGMRDFRRDGGYRCGKGENLPVSQFYHVSVDKPRESQDA
jgi:hypothetical protein